MGIVTGPDRESALRQVKKAREFEVGVELKCDAISPDEVELPIMPKIHAYHNFEETPIDLESLVEYDKIACMANSTLDTMRLLLFAQAHPGKIVIAMGELGIPSRILSPVMGCPYTFCALEGRPAPGVQPVEEHSLHYNRLNPSSEIYGLIGNPVSQSPSHITHNAYFAKHGIDAVYVKFCLEEEELPEFFEMAKQLGIRGLSVTRPFKEKLFPFIDELEVEDLPINTITFEDGKVYGGNTDGMGAVEAIGEVRGMHCLIVGAGGSAKAINRALENAGATVTMTRERLQSLPEYDVLINATPTLTPFDPELLHSNKTVMEINYNSSEEPFMRRAGEKGCRLIYGEEMFAAQAMHQFVRWAIEEKSSLAKK